MWRKVIVLLAWKIRNDRFIWIGCLAMSKNERAEYVVGIIRHRRTLFKVLSCVEYVVRSTASVVIA
jgi:hypothetical protein